MKSQVFYVRLAAQLGRLDMDPEVVINKVHAQFVSPLVQWEKLPLEVTSNRLRRLQNARGLHSVIVFSSLQALPRRRRTARKWSRASASAATEVLFAVNGPCARPVCQSVVAPLQQRDRPRKSDDAGAALPHYSPQCFSLNADDVTIDEGRTADFDLAVAKLGLPPSRRVHRVV